MNGGEGINLKSLDNYKALRKDLSSIKTMRNKDLDLPELSPDKVFKPGTFGNCIVSGLMEGIQTYLGGSHRIVTTDLSSVTEVKKGSR
jgi:hypothetical protein